MYTWKKYREGKHGGWGVYYPNGILVSVCTYRKGAVALCELLNGYKREIEDVTSATADVSTVRQ